MTARTSATTCATPAARSGSCKKEQLAHALGNLYGRYDRRSLNDKRAILVDLNRLARGELRENREEVREDRRERREDHRERREDVYRR